MIIKNHFTVNLLSSLAAYDFENLSSKKFSDGTCKYLPFVELLLC